MRVLLVALVCALSFQLATEATQDLGLPLEETSGLSPKARRERLKEFNQKHREFRQKWRALAQERQAERKKLREQAKALMSVRQKSRAEATQADWKTLSPEQRQARRTERVARIKLKREQKRQSAAEGSATQDDAPSR